MGDGAKLGSHLARMATISDEEWAAWRRSLPHRNAKAQRWNAGPFEKRCCLTEPP